MKGYPYTVRGYIFTCRPLQVQWNLFGKDYYALSAEIYQFGLEAGVGIVAKWRPKWIRNIALKSITRPGGD